VTFDLASGTNSSADVAVRSPAGARGWGVWVTPSRASPPHKSECQEPLDGTPVDRNSVPRSRSKSDAYPIQSIALVKDYYRDLIGTLRNGPFWYLIAAAIAVEDDS